MKGFFIVNITGSGDLFEELKAKSKKMLKPLAVKFVFNETNEEGIFILPFGSDESSQEKIDCSEDVIMSIHKTFKHAERLSLINICFDDNSCIYLGKNTFILEQIVIYLVLANCYFVYEEDLNGCSVITFFSLKLEYPEVKLLN